MRDWRKAKKDRLQRIYLYVMEPTVFGRCISKYDLEHLDRMQVALSLFQHYMSESKVEKALVKAIKSLRSVAEVRPIIRDCKELFGDMMERDKDFDRMILRERLYKIAERAKDSEDYDTERKCIDSIMKLDGLDKHESVDAVPELKLPKIVFSNNISALLESDAEEAEIVEDEEE